MKLLANLILFILTALAAALCAVAVMRITAILISDI